LARNAFSTHTCAVEGIAARNDADDHQVDQERIDESSRLIDIFAELVSPNGKLSNAVHLQLKVATSSDGQFVFSNRKI